MRRTTIAVALTVVIAAATHVDAQEAARSPQTVTPFYAAFKKFCIDTAVIPGKIDDAAKAEGGVLFEPYSEKPPTVATPHQWKVEVDGRVMDLGIFPVVHLQQGPIGMSCRLHSADDENASLPLLAAWAGVPRDLTKTYAEIYHFAQQGTTHQPLGDFDKVATGWVLDVTKGPGTNALLVHFGPDQN